MSKEMTPKDALEKISWRFPNEPSFQEWCNIINQALDRLEETNFNYHIALAFCEASKEEKQELYKQIKQLERENQELRNKLNINFEDCADELCEALTQRDKLYDENLKLQKENQELETDKKMLNALYQEVKDTASFYMSKCEKFEKVIDILKNKLKLSLSEYKTIKTINAVLPIGNNEMNRLAQQEYELLKEVLESV